MLAVCLPGTETTPGRQQAVINPHRKHMTAKEVVRDIAEAHWADIMAGLGLATLEIELLIKERFAKHSDEWVAQPTIDEVAWVAAIEVLEVIQRQCARNIEIANAFRLIVRYVEAATLFNALTAMDAPTSEDYDI